MRDLRIFWTALRDSGWIIASSAKINLKIKNKNGTNHSHVFKIDLV